MILSDPTGEEHERERLRCLGKWRFILLRGLLGVGAPVFLWLAVSRLKEDIRTAQLLHQDVFWYVFRSLLVGSFIVGFLSCVVGLLAWRRLTSDYWPGQPSDTEAAHTTIGPLTRLKQDD